MLLPFFRAVERAELAVAVFAGQVGVVLHPGDGAAAVLDRIGAEAQLEPIAAVAQLVIGFYLLLELCQTADDLVARLCVQQDVEQVGGAARREFIRLHPAADLREDVPEHVVARLYTVDIIEEGKVRHVERHHRIAAVAAQHMRGLQPEAQVVPAAGYLVRERDIRQAFGIPALQDNKENAAPAKQQNGDQR